MRIHLTIYANLLIHIFLLKLTMFRLHKEFKYEIKHSTKKKLELNNLHQSKQKIMHVQILRLINHRLKPTVWKILIPNFKWDLISYIDIAYIRINKFYPLIFVVIHDHSPCSLNTFCIWIIYYRKCCHWRMHNTFLSNITTGCLNWNVFSFAVNQPCMNVDSASLQTMKTCSNNYG